MATKTYRILIFILFFILLCGTLFFTSINFIEKEILPKGYFFISFSLLLGFTLLLNNHPPVLLDRLTIIIILFTSYLALISIFTSSIILSIFFIISFLFLFFFFKTDCLSYKIINCIIILLCIMQAGYGLLQYFYFFHSTSNFRIVGSYDNPAGFAACLAVSAPLSFTFFRYSLSYNIFGIISFMIISVAIVLSGSRAGIISITLASAIFLYSQLSNKKKLLKKYLIPVFFILGIALFICCT